MKFKKVLVFIFALILIFASLINIFNIFEERENIGKLLFDMVSPITIIAFAFILLSKYTKFLSWLVFKIRIRFIQKAYLEISLDLETEAEIIPNELLLSNFENTLYELSKNCVLEKGVEYKFINKKDEIPIDIRSTIIGNQIQLETNPIYLPISEFTQILENYNNVLNLIVEQLEANNQITYKNYSGTIRFKSSNPYLGYFFNQSILHNNNKVKNMSLTLEDDTFVRSKSIEINNKDFNALLRSLEKNLLYLKSET